MNMEVGREEFSHPTSDKGKFSLWSNTSFDERYSLKEHGALQTLGLIHP
jgi:hypothetical protein